MNVIFDAKLRVASELDNFDRKHTFVYASKAMKCCSWLDFACWIVREICCSLWHLITYAERERTLLLLRMKSSDPHTKICANESPDSNMQSISVENFRFFC